MSMSMSMSIPKSLTKKSRVFTEGGRLLARTRQTRLRHLLKNRKLFSQKNNDVIGCCSTCYICYVIQYILYVLKWQIFFGFCEGAKTFSIPQFLMYKAEFADFSKYLSDFLFKSLLPHVHALNCTLIGINLRDCILIWKQFAWLFYDLRDACVTVLLLEINLRHCTVL